MGAKNYNENRQQQDEDDAKEKGEKTMNENL